MLMNAVPDCTGSIDLSSHGRLSPYAVDGLSVAEGFGRWSDGDRASFTCKTSSSAGAPRHVKVATAAFLPSGRTQRLIVSMAGGETGTYTYDPAHPSRSLMLTIPDAAIAAGQLHLSFMFPDAVSPKELGLSGDARRLAISFSEISFQ